ncbi:fatty acid desaturase [Methylobacterium sp. R2-1]|uniref:fatty acid desaturase n=1 Tax=Methylobacterium sp. R2-1 TaxID=2587064 RepID=UPI00161CB573|nr:fatty acid desaturase [Methylobacterium sp. R2-1]MBB2961410.1 omega-6 fatty acid desaturase (delta-12 desaturase) [Methylobacterium sp. R2-1]
MTIASLNSPATYRLADEASRTDEAKLAQEVARHCAAFREPIPRLAFRQVADTLLPYLILCALMLSLAANGYELLTLPLALPAGGLLVRLFIIQHDCGHGSFLPSRRGNDWLGRALSLLTVTPYDSWKRAHALHHASTGDLSRRGTGDVCTLTVREYLNLPRWGRVRYRLYRNPLILIGLGSPINFLVMQRFPNGVGLPWRTAWRNVLALDAVLLVVLGALAFTTGGLGPVLWVLLPVVSVAAWIGGWLFYVQHQYEETVWEEADAWDFHLAALGGSSYYVLPRVLQWFTGNVGLHHVHHLNSRIPNYRLQECLDGHEILGRVGRLTLHDSLACLKLALWDEDARKMVGFARLRRLEAA